MTPQARPARKDDVRELSHTLARAFYDDPVMVWLLPDEKPRTVQLYRLFATMTRHHHLARGGVEVACDGPAIGAAHSTRRGYLAAGSMASSIWLRRFHSARSSSDRSG